MDENKNAAETGQQPQAEPQPQVQPEPQPQAQPEPQPQYQQPQQADPQQYQQPQQYQPQQQYQQPGYQAPEKPTTLGMDVHIAAMLCFVGGIIYTYVGLIASVVIFFVEKKNQFVKFCAAQGIVLYGGGSVLMILLSIINAIALRATRFDLYSGLRLSPVAIIVSILIWIVGIALFGISIYLVVMSLQKKNTRLPIIGNIADKLMGH